MAPSNSFFMACMVLSVMVGFCYTVIDLASWENEQILGDRDSETQGWSLTGAFLVAGGKN